MIVSSAEVYTESKGTSFITTHIYRHSGLCWALHKLLVAKEERVSATLVRSRPQDLDTDVCAATCTQEAALAHGPASCLPLRARESRGEGV